MRKMQKRILSLLLTLCVALPLLTVAVSAENAGIDTVHDRAPGGAGPAK